MTLAIMTCLMVCGPALPASPPAEGLLLASTRPGSYSLRVYDRALVVTGQSKQDYVLTLAVARRPQWVGCDGRKLPLSAWRWAQGVLEVPLKSGRHTLLVAFDEEVRFPGPTRPVPVMMGGRQIGSLTGWGDFDGFVARAKTSVGQPFTARLRVVLRPEVQVPADAVKMTVGKTLLDRWSASTGRLLARRRALVMPETRMTLSARGAGAAEAIKALVFEQPRFATDPPPGARMPARGIVLEAEDFCREGAGHVQISHGAHVDEHGGASVYSNAGDGHWLEWEFEAPAEGDYDLFARVACDPPYSLRELRVDGRLPAAGYALIRFPHTGGWGYSPEEWWAIQVAGARPDLPPLYLNKGKHRLRLKGVGPNHLNLDYFVLRPHEAHKGANSTTRRPLPRCRLDSHELESSAAGPAVAQVPRRQ